MCYVLRSGIAYRHEMDHQTAMSAMCRPFPLTCILVLLAVLMAGTLLVPTI